MIDLNANGTRLWGSVIAELTIWALELTFQSEINVGSRLSERIEGEDHETRDEPSACAKEEANQSEWRQGSEVRPWESERGLR